MPSCRLAFADELFDAADDVLDVELGGVDLHGVLCGHHPLGVALVAEAEVGREGVGSDLGPLGEAALGADRTVGVQVDLHVRTGTDDSADVAPFEDRVAELGELALAGAHDFAHVRVTRDPRDEPVDPRLPDRRGHVGLVDPDAAVLVERDRVVLGERAEALALAERNVVRHREPGQRPVHRAGVEVAVADPLRKPAGDRAFARSRRPVDGNDHRCVTDSSSSKNPGKLTATASAFSISTPSLEVSPATAPSMAILWSPRVCTGPPRGRAGTPRTRNPSSLAAIRTPTALSEFVTVSMRSVSLTRSSCAPSTTLTPRACEAASAKSGNSSTSRGTSSGAIEVASSGASRTSMSATGSPPALWRLKTAIRAPIRSSKSSRP